MTTGSATFMEALPRRRPGTSSRARQLSLSLLYWMQTEAPRRTGGRGWRGLRLRPDVMGTSDGLAMYPYVREARRIQAEFTVLEQHVGVDAREKLAGKSRDELTAERFDDSVGVGQLSASICTRRRKATTTPTSLLCRSRFRSAR